jgi:mannose-1-phosphate guanylyltransferase/mannose-6-phosphate isomerase
MSALVNCVILCGGTGSRLWPLSRDKLPKQFLSLVNERTMLQNTVLRFQKLNVSKITMICNKEHSFLIKQQIEDLGLEINIEIVVEPMGRDTAAATCIAALLGDAEENTLIVPCDHMFDDDAFVNVVNQGLEFIETSVITFGIKPTHPETGYGYIHMDKTTQDTICFVEKPNYETAEKYIETGDYYWNAGVFLFKNKNMRACFEKYSPDILESCEKTLNESKLKRISEKRSEKRNEKQHSNNLNLDLDADLFSETRKISVDYAIMEKLCSDSNIEVTKKTIPYNSTWCDIGSFYSLHEHLLSRNKEECASIDKNVFKGDVLSIDTTNSYIESENSLVAVVGVDNLVVVNTRDALLICNKDKTQMVKQVVDSLKKTKREEHVIHAKAYRPWGWYINVEGNDFTGFKVKRIGVYPGKKLSLQSHNKRSEHWVIVKGTAKMQLGEEFIVMNVNDHVYIPVQALHRIENIHETEMLEFVETQIGDYLGEDDIVRYEDDFGRV